MGNPDGWYKYPERYHHHHCEHDDARAGWYASGWWWIRCHILLRETLMVNKLCKFLIVFVFCFVGHDTSTSARLLKGGGKGVVIGDEFVGPFANWQSVKASPCNAVGNGSTDDTSAIQTCLT